MSESNVAGQKPPESSPALSAVESRDLLSRAIEAERLAQEEWEAVNAEMRPMIRKRDVAFSKWVARHDERRALEPLDNA